MILVQKRKEREGKEKGEGKLYHYCYLEKTKLYTEPSKLYVICHCELLCHTSRVDPERWVGLGKLMKERERDTQELKAAPPTSPPPHTQKSKKTLTKTRIKSLSDSLF